MTHAVHRSRGAAARGVTLLEMTLSLSLGALLLAALGSAVVLASRALPDRTTPAQAQAGAARVLAELAQELGTARYLTERGERRVTAVLATRAADGRPDVVRYGWDGATGSALRRDTAQHAGDVLPDVREFLVRYDTAEQRHEWQVAGSTSAVRKHAGYTGTNNLAELTVSPTLGVAQVVTPSWTAEWSSWSVTKLRLRLGRNGGRDMVVQLRAAEADGRPGATVLGSATIAAAALSTQVEWVAVPINVPSIAVGQRVCVVVLAGGGSGNAGSVEYVHAGASGLATTSDGGSAWVWGDDGVNDARLRYEVHGTYTLQPVAVALTQEVVTAVRLRVRAGSASSLQWTTARLLNRPRVLARVWELDFGAPPGAVDLDLDGAADWCGWANEPLCPDAPAGGVWPLDEAIYAAPPTGLPGVTRVEVRLRDTGDDGSCGGVKLYADQGHAGYGYVEVCIDLQGSSQLLLVTTQNDDATVQTWVSATVPAGRFADAELLIDGASDRVLVLVGGQPVGVFGYELIPWTPPCSVDLCPGDGDGIELDHLRIRSGGAVTITGPNSLPVAQAAAGDGSGRTMLDVLH